MGFSFYNIKRLMEQKFDLRDISLIPMIESPISSRQECETRYRNNNGTGFLPLMASPMDTVVCSKNLNKFLDNGIIPCAPRGKQIFPDFSRMLKFDNIYQFQSFGLNEIEEQLRERKNQKLNKLAFYHHQNILIDIANAHMSKLIDIIKEIKESCPNTILMVGNVAHPLTYKNLAMAGADFIRISIGSGTGCTTAANVAINYPLGSLISECYKIKKESNLSAKIVADGGMQGYDDIIKSLALGADYIMIGSLFNKAMQSAGFNYLWRIKVPYDLAKLLWKWGFPIKKKYRGMSAKAVQRKWGKTKLVTAEGITKYQKIEYNLDQWVENFEDYLRSCMSYCGARNLEDFIGKAEWVFITENAFNRFKK
jgi:GMP reductase